MDTDSLNRWLAFAANVGVLFGLMLLTYEVHQNSELMRAQISMDRANSSIQILADLANGGELVPIDVKLREAVEDFPQSLGWSSMLTAEEKRRYEFWMYARLAELNNDWFQCSAGLIPQEVCRTEIVAGMRASLHRYYELGISFTRSQSTFVAEMQNLARLEELPEINDNGTWELILK